MRITRLLNTLTSFLLPVTLIAAVLVAPVPASCQSPETADPAKETEATPVEIWKGILNAGPQKIEMQFRVFEGSDEEQPAKIDVISQGANGLPATVKRDGNELTFEIPVIASKYVGKLSEDGETLKGHWHQSGLELPFDLAKVEKAFSEEDQWKSRPQFPKAPFPYESVEVKVPNEADGITLAGTLTIPKAAGPFPAVILISGSGPQDRDETLMGHKPFAVIADHLSRNGIAVLRLDDRGVGESTGQFGTATTEDFSRDAEAALDFLKKQEMIAADKIGLAGHSEGGLIAPIVAARRGDVGFIVLLAGPGIDGAEIVRRQSKLIARAEGIPEPMIELNEKIFTQAFDAIKKSKPGDDLDAEMERIVNEAASDLPEAEGQAGEAMKKQLAAQLNRLTAPWFKFFMSYDPKPTLREVKCPTLAMIGEKDLQVPAEVNLTAIREGLSEGGHKDFEVVELEGLNHLFQTAGTGSPTEYSKIDETFAPVALEKMTDWIQSKTSASDSTVE